MVKAGTAVNAVHSVDRAVSILQVIGRQGPASVGELSSELGLHKSTVFRLLATLEARGLIEQNAHRGRYQLGYGIVQLAAGATRKLDLSVVSRPVCEELAEQVGETVNIAVSDGTAVTSIDQVLGAAGVTTVNWVGQRTPLHATSAGQVFLADMTPTERDECLPNPLPRYTEHTIGDRSALDDRLELVAAQGWAATSEEHEIGLVAVAAPIRDLTGKLVAAVTVSGPSFRVTAPRLAELAEQVLRAAAAISQRNGAPKPG